jgi:glutamate-1-semialdehyde aminotransferase
VNHLVAETKVKLLLIILEPVAGNMAVFTAEGFLEGIRQLVMKKELC